MMELYAIVTSERASKGQGGNEFLFIKLRDENGVVARIDFYGDSIDLADSGGIRSLKLNPLHKVNYCSEHLKYNCEAKHAKGKKKKGERYCEGCNMPVPSDEHHNCLICGARTR